MSTNLCGKWLRVPRLIVKANLQLKFWQRRLGFVCARWEKKNLGTCLFGFFWQLSICYFAEEHHKTTQSANTRADQSLSCVREALSAGIDAVMSAMSGETRFTNENEVPCKSLVPRFRIHVTR